MSGGRPTSFKPEFIKQAKKLAELGATDRDAADFFEVSESTLNLWKLKNRAFSESLKIGKEIADQRVEQSLYRRALGYSHDAVKIMTVGKDVHIQPFVEHFPPDTTAAIFWLKNRRPDKWRDVSRSEITGKDGGAIEIDQRLKEDHDAVSSGILGLVERIRASELAETTQH